MHLHRSSPRTVLVWLWLAAVAPCVAAEDPCGEFAWEIRHERQLFSQPPTELAAGKSNTTAAAVIPDRLYELRLAPWAQVSFPVPPLGHHSTSEGSYAGIAQLRLPAAGTWRISLSEPAWVDIVNDRTVVQPKDFQGRRGCSTPHKILRYELPAGGALTLQLSGARGEVVRVVVSKDSGG